MYACRLPSNRLPKLRSNLNSKRFILPEDLVSTIAFTTRTLEVLPKYHLHLASPYGPYKPTASRNLIRIPRRHNPQENQWQQVYDVQNLPLCFPTPTCTTWLTMTELSHRYFLGVRHFHEALVPMCRRRLFSLDIVGVQLGEAERDQREHRRRGV